MNQALKFKKFLRFGEAFDLFSEHKEGAKPLTLYEYAYQGVLPLSIETDSGILDFMLTDKACKDYLKYLKIVVPKSIAWASGDYENSQGASFEITQGRHDYSPPPSNQPYTFKDSQSGEVIELPEFPNGIIGFRSKPLLTLIGLDIPSSENEELPAPVAKKVNQDLSIRNDAIRQDAKNGFTNPQLQEKYGLSKTSISDICNEEKKTIGGNQNVMANVTRRIIKG